MKNTSKSNTRITDDSDVDAIKLLVADHKKVKQLFKEFKSLVKAKGNDEDKEEIVTRLCHELTIHMQVEEELFYPAVQRALDEDAILDEAYVEHDSARQLIEQLQTMQPNDPLYDARVAVLDEQIEHHVKEEETEMFPKAKKTKVDMVDLGAQMADRKSALKVELGLADDEGETAALRPRGRAASPTSHHRAATDR